MIPTEFVKVRMQMCEESSMGSQMAFSYKVRARHSLSHRSRIHIHRTHYTTHQNEKPLKRKTREATEKETKNKNKNRETGKNQKKIIKENNQNKNKK